MYSLFFICKFKFIWILILISKYYRTLMNFMCFYGFQLQTHYGTIWWNRLDENRQTGLKNSIDSFARLKNHRTFVHGKIVWRDYNILVQISNLYYFRVSTSYYRYMCFYCKYILCTRTYFYKFIQINIT